MDYRTMNAFISQGRLKSKVDYYPSNIEECIALEPVVFEHEFDAPAGKSLSILWKVAGQEKQEIFPLWSATAENVNDAFCTDSRYTQVGFIGKIKEWPRQRCAYSIYNPTGINIDNGEIRIMHGFIPIGMRQNEPVSFILQVVERVNGENRIFSPENYYDESREVNVYMEMMGCDKKFKVIQLG